MRVVVCAKQIPDPANPYRLDPQTNYLVRPNDQVLDDTDRYGVEMGLQLAQKAGGAVTIVSMGPTGSMQGLRQALAMGAEKAIVIDDAELKGSDALQTARVLAEAIKKEGFDLVIAGTESTDGYSGVVPQMVAELLDIPALTYATQVEATEGKVTIHRQTASGYDVVEAALPALVSVTAGVVEPRYPTFKGIMDAKKKPVDNHSAGDLGVTASPAEKVTEVTNAPTRSGGTKIEDDGEAFQKIVELLAQKKVI
ncbi:MAG: electron transfer flavoprotein subunit alpha [Acidimicrobiia bacterium]|nr:electron transfer flavoprotein subunit beta/FixA family protein [Acidimicrobiia bacterium]MDQ3500678.1 electron transfer flavoprotein subunit beta/FixA family protein [Actinomycetota bacterium]